jgi:Transcriptional Coactivator p15 (PC4)
MPDERELVYCFDRSATEQVQVSLSKYKSKTYADIRIYYRADDGEYRPTKKGITVSPSQLPELGEAIRKLIEKVEGTG